MPTRSTSGSRPARCDTRNARYEAISDRAVRVSGSRFAPAGEYTIKLEGVRQGGYSTMLMGGVRDPFILAEIDSWLEQLDDNIRMRIAATVGNRPYEIVTRVYGRDGVMGALEPEKKVGGHEVFILWDVISESQELSRAIAASVSHLAVHNPIPKWHGLISGRRLSLFAAGARPRPGLRVPPEPRARAGLARPACSAPNSSRSEADGATIADLAVLVRSKNAGPFWLTIDIMFDDARTATAGCATAEIDQPRRHRATCTAATPPTSSSSTTTWRWRSR